MAIAISMVMLQEDSDPLISDFRHELSSNWPELEISEDISKDDYTLSFEIGNSNIILGKMSAPLLVLLQEWPHSATWKLKLKECPNPLVSFVNACYLYQST